MSLPKWAKNVTSSNQYSEENNAKRNVAVTKTSGGNNTSSLPSWAKPYNNKKYKNAYGFASDTPISYAPATQAKVNAEKTYSSPYKDTIVKDTISMLNNPLSQIKKTPTAVKLESEPAKSTVLKKQPLVKTNAIDYLKNPETIKKANAGEFVSDVATEDKESILHKLDKDIRGSLYKGILNTVKGGASALDTYGDVIDKYGKTATSLLPNLGLKTGLNIIGKYADSDIADKVNNNLSDAVQRNDQAMDYENMSKAGQFFSDTVSSIPQMGTFLVPGMGSALFGMTAAGNYADEARQKGANLEQAALKGAIGGATEVGLQRALGVIPGYKNIYKDTFDKGLLEMPSKILTSKAFGTQLVKQMGREGLEELLTDPVTGLADKAIYQPDKKMFGDNGVFDLKQMGLDFLGGALMSGIIDAPSMVREGANVKYVKNYIESNAPKLIETADSMPMTDSFNLAQTLKAKGNKITAQDIEDLQNTITADQTANKEKQRTEQALNNVSDLMSNKTSALENEKVVNTTPEKTTVLNKKGEPMEVSNDIVEEMSEDKNKQKVNEYVNTVQQEATAEQEAAPEVIKGDNVSPVKSVYDTNKMDRKGYEDYYGLNKVVDTSKKNESEQAVVGTFRKLLTDVGRKVVDETKSTDIKEISEFYVKKYNLPKPITIIYDNKLTNEVGKSGARIIINKNKDQSINKVTVKIPEIDANMSAEDKSIQIGNLRHEIEHYIDVASGRNTINKNGNQRLSGLQTVQDILKNGFQNHHGNYDLFESDYLRRSTIRNAIKNGEELPESVMKEYEDNYKEKESIKKVDTSKTSLKAHTEEKENKQANTKVSNKNKADKPKSVKKEVKIVLPKVGEEILIKTDKRLDGGKVIRFVENNPVVEYETAEGKQQGIFTKDGENYIPAKVEPTKESEIPMEDRSFGNVGNQKIKAYQYIHPELASYIQDEAKNVLGEFENTLGGGPRTQFNEKDQVSGGYRETRVTSSTIAEILDEKLGSYEEIKTALDRIINNHGSENKALAKKIEILIDDRLSRGYYDDLNGMDIPKNEEYIALKNKIEGSKKEVAASKEVEEPISLEDISSLLNKGLNNSINYIKGENVSPRKFVKNFIADYPKFNDEETIKKLTDSISNDEVFKVVNTRVNAKQPWEMVKDEYQGILDTELKNMPETSKEYRDLQFSIKMQQGKANKIKALQKKEFLNSGISSATTERLNKENQKLKELQSKSDELYNNHKKELSKWSNDLVGRYPSIFTLSDETGVTHAGFHDSIVKKALSEGKAVPAEVLKEYPELNTPPTQLKPHSEVLENEGANTKGEDKKAQEKAETGKFTYSKDDIPYDLAYSAYRAISMDPERVARDEQTQYVNSMKDIENKANAIAKTDEQKAIAIQELNRYRNKFIQMQKAILQAKSRTMSAMVTGPANFPTARNQKRLETEHNRTVEFLEWQKKAEKSILNKIKNSGLPEDKFISVKKNLDFNIDVIVGILDKKEFGDISLFRNSIVGKLKRIANNGDLETFNKALGYIKQKQTETGKTILAKNNSIWSYGEQAAHKLETKQEVASEGEKSVKEYEGAKIINNPEAERVQIFMDEKPDKEISSELSHNGWHYSPANKAWQRKNTPQAGRNAISIMDKYYKANEQSFDSKVNFTQNLDIQTDTPQFKKWFGDSKVIDGNGKPLTVFHGTPNKFTVFDKNKIGDSTGNYGFFGKGFYFSANKMYSDAYGGSMPVYLSIQKPYMLDKNTNIKELAELAENRPVTDNEDYVDNISDTIAGNEEIFADNLKKSGYDGVILNNMLKFTEIVAFEPNQIKSATGNKGTFDETKDSIYDSKVDFPQFLDDNKGSTETGEIKKGQFVENSVKNSVVTPDPVKEYFDENPDFYAVVGNDATWQKAQNDAEKDFDGIQSRIIKNKALIGETDMARALAIYKEYISQGDLENAHKWVNIISPMIRQNARALQFTSTLKRFTPEWTLIHAEREINKARSKKQNDKLDKVTGQTETAMGDVNDESIDDVVKGVLDQLNNKHAEEMQVDKKEIAELEKKVKELEKTDNKGNKEGNKKAEEEIEKALDDPEDILAKKIQKYVDNDDLPRDKNLLSIMLNTLYKVAKVDLPERVKTKTTLTAKEIVQLAMTDKTHYTEVWTTAKEIVKANYEGDTETLGALEPYFDNMLNVPFTEKQLNKAVLDEIKDKGIDLNTLVRKHYSEVDKANKTLSESFISAGMDKETSEQLAAYVEKEFSDITTEKKKKILNDIFVKVKAPAKTRQDYISKIIEYSNLGAFTDEDIRPYVAKKLGMSALSKEASQQIIDLSNKIQETPVGRERAELIAKLTDTIQREIPTSILEKIGGAQAIMMLSSPKTPIRNFVSNLIFASVTGTKNIGRTIMDVPIGAKTGERTSVMPEPIEWAKGFAKGYKDVWLDFIHDVDTRTSEDKTGLRRTHTFDSKTMHFVERLVKMGLDDRGFKQAAIQSELKKAEKLAKLNGIEFNSIEAFTKAKAVADYVTFNDTNKFSSGLVRARNWLNGGKGFGLGDMVIKFARTPANILLRAIDYSPVSIFKATGGAIADSYHGYEFDQEKFADNLAKGLTGSMMIGLGVILMAMKSISLNDEKDKDKAAFDRQTGLSNFSINISNIGRFMRGARGKKLGVQDGDLLVTYDWGQPISILLTLGASVFKATTEREIQKTGDIVNDFSNKALEAGSNIWSGTAAGMNSLVDQPLLQGIQQLFNYGNVAEGFGNLVLGLPRSFTPALGNNLKQLLDNSYRETSSTNIIMTNLNKAAARIPFLEKKLPVASDTLGRNSKTFVNDNNNPFNVLINPANVTRYTLSTQAEKAIQIINDKTSSKIQYPKVAPKTFDFEGKTYVLTGKEKVDFQKSMGKQVNELFNSKYAGAVSKYDSAENLLNIAKQMSTDITNIYENTRLEYVKSKGTEVSKKKDKQKKISLYLK